MTTEPNMLMDLIVFAAAPINDDVIQFHGIGNVIGVDGTALLVEVLPIADDDEPRWMVVLDRNQPGLSFHKTLAHFNAWFDYKPKPKPDPETPPGEPIPFRKRRR